MARKSKVAWVPAFRYFLSLIKISSKELTEPGRITLYRAQERALDEIVDAIENGQYFLACLKARQLGISTLFLALDIFWLYMHPGIQGALIFDTGENREQARQTITEMLESLPSKYRIPVKKHDRNMLVLANGSRLQYMNAGKGKNSGLGRSRALNFVHACVPGDTPVIVGDGWVKEIKDVAVGDEVLTHTGQRARVVDAWSSENDKGALIRITPWLGKPLSFTGDHHIPTQRGIIDARDVTKDDWLVMPIRKITKEVTCFTLPITSRTGRRGGAISAGSGQEIELNEETGYACGYFLAEGHIIRQTRDNRPSAIHFSRHRNEVEYGSRAVKALRNLASSHRSTDRRDSLTSFEILYGSALSGWMEKHFGALDEKRIPDYIWTWGSDFCRGLIAGLLCGDGSKTCTPLPVRHRRHAPVVTKKGKLLGRPPTGCSNPDKTYAVNRVSLTTTRSSLATQSRDMVASLGYGWASISAKTGGVLHGRNCKPTWIVDWAGAPAAILRGLMGLSVAGGGKPNFAHYKMDDGSVWIKIRGIETGIKCDRIYDLTVDHEDHTFRTPHMAIGNSEVSSWGDQKGIDSLIRAMSETNPNRLYLFESTALGFNAFYDLYQKAKSMPDQKAFFIGWWAKDSYAYADGSKEYAHWWGENPELTEDEAERVRIVKELYDYEVTSEQIAWYRAQQYDASEESLAEELPWYENEAWQATGSPFFSQKRLTEDMNFIDAAKVGFKGFRYELGEKFFSMRIIPCDSVDLIDLRVWEEPKPGAKYVIGVDSAYGRSADADQSIVSVWRCFADMLVQVAEYASPVPETRQVAWVMAHLAGVYRDCMINLEINGPGSEVMMNLKHLREQMTFGDLVEPAKKLGQGQCLDNARWFLWKKPDTQGHAYAFNFSTNFNSKAAAFNKYRDHYNTSRLAIRSIPLLEEMKTLKQDGDSIGASGRNKDDRVMGGVLATYAWDEWVRPEMTALGRTYDKEMAAEQSRETAPDKPFVEHIVANFFKEQAKVRSDEQLRVLLGGRL